MNRTIANRIVGDLTTIEEDLATIRYGLAHQSPQRLRPVEFTHPEPPRPDHYRLAPGCFHAKRHRGCP